MATLLVLLLLTVCLGALLDNHRLPTHRLREMPEFADATCIAIACPACMTLGLAQSCAGYVTTVINNTDMVPTMSLGACQPRQDVDTFQGLLSCSWHACSDHLRVCRWQSVQFETVQVAEPAVTDLHCR